VLCAVRHWEQAAVGQTQQQASKYVSTVITKSLAKILKDNYNKSSQYKCERICFFVVNNIPSPLRISLNQEQLVRRGYANVPTNPHAHRVGKNARNLKAIGGGFLPFFFY
jgi:hypothetical protein